MTVRLDDVLLALVERLDPDGWATASDVAAQLGQSLAVTQTELQLLEAEGLTEQDDLYVWTITREGYERVHEVVEQS